MNYWKHKMISLLDDNSEEDWTKRLDQYGAEGWELTTSAPFEGGVSFFFRRIDYERQMKERMESMERLHKGKLEARELLGKIRKEPNHTDQ